MNVFALCQECLREGIAICPSPMSRGRHSQSEGQEDGRDREVDTTCADKAEIAICSLVHGTGDREQRLPDRVAGADLAVVLALLDPGTVFVRERGGGGTSLMRREADGTWYFID